MTQKGFTLIEAVLAISIVAIIAGFAISAINPIRQRQRAQDSVLRSQLKDITEGIETYKVIHGSYPYDADGDGNPIIDSSTPTPLNTYMQTWPAGFTYNTSGGQFAVYIVTASNPDLYFKYYSGWGQIRECGSLNIATPSECN